MAPQDRFGAYHFDAFRLDPVRGAVQGPGGAELRLRPKAFALLRHLLDNPGRLLGREELLDTLWPGVVVTDDSLTQCVGDLRHAFGGRAARVLRTVPKRGYMLIAEVRRDEPPRPEAHTEVRQEPAPAAAPAPPRDVAARRRDPVAVHRFETPDGERACVLLAEALVTDLIAAGTHLEGLRILPATKAVGAGNYRIAGEVRAVGADLRVTVRLEEAASGVALWAERLDKPRDGPPMLSEGTLLALAAQLHRQVALHSLAAARGKPVEALSARELCLVGKDHHGRGTEADMAVAKQMFARAIEADPDYAPAYAWQAYTVHRAITHGWGSPGGQEARDEALRLARRAVQLQPDSPLSLSRLAFALVLHQRWEEAVAAARAALGSHRPAFAAARNTCCEVLAAAGHPEEAARIARETIALEPLCPPSTHALLGRALLLAGEVEEALAPLRWCASRLPDYAPVHDSLVVAAAESGRLPEALAARAELSRLRPGWEPRNHTGLWYFRRPEDVERFHAAHRRLDEADGHGHLAEAPAPGTDLGMGRGPSPPGPPALRPLGPRGPAALRQETLLVHPLQAAPDDAAAVRAASAIAADLMAELVRYEDLRVVAGPDERATRGFAVRGEVHAVDGNLCASLRLDDLATGTTFWAKRVEWPSGRAPGPPVGEIAALAAAMDLQIGRKSLRRARQKPEEELSARELTALGKEHYHRSTEAETEQARTMLARASVLDPGYAAAHAWHAFAVARVAVHGWNGPSRWETVERSVHLARRAVELEPESPLSLSSLSLSLALQDQWEEAVVSARLALRTGRVAGDGARIAAGDVLAAAGFAAEAEKALRYAVIRDPHCSPVVHAVLGRVLLLRDRPEEAVGELRRCAVQLPDYTLCFRTLVVAAMEAGLVEEARGALREVGRLRPGWITGAEPIFWFLRRKDDTERWQKAFQVAVRLDATAQAGGLLEAPASRA